MDVFVLKLWSWGVVDAMGVHVNRVNANIGGNDGRALGASNFADLGILDWGGHFF